MTLDDKELDLKATEITIDYYKFEVNRLNNLIAEKDLEIEILKNYDKEIKSIQVKNKAYIEYTNERKQYIASLLEDELIIPYSRLVSNHRLHKIKRLYLKCRCKQIDNKDKFKKLRSLDLAIHVNCPYVVITTQGLVNCGLRDMRSLLGARKNEKTSGL